MVNANVVLIAVKRLRAEKQIVRRLRIGCTKIGRGQKFQRGDRTRIEQIRRNEVAGERVGYDHAIDQTARARVVNLAIEGREIAIAKGYGRYVFQARRRARAAAQAFIVGKEKRLAVPVVNFRNPNGAANREAELILFEG